MSDSPDAKGFLSGLLGTSKIKADDKCKSPTELDAHILPAQGITVIDKYEDYYKMAHLKRGKAIIFNHYEFDSKLNNRSGTHKDAKDLKLMLEAFSFDVALYHDLKYNDIADILSKLSKEDHTDADCILIAVMTHGDPGLLHARDYNYPVEYLWAPFTGDRCPTLAGKPKLFFIQACRGEQIDAGTVVSARMRTEVDGNKQSTYKIPAMADILIMYSTFEGYYSWRSSGSGSWFIQSLCKALKEHGRERDLLTVLTFANRQVAVEDASYCPHRPSIHQKKQTGTIVSTLTRLLFFGVKEEKMDEESME